MLHTGKQTWKARKSSLLQKDSKHQSQTDVFKLIWLSQGPHAIIYNQALKEGGQDYCGVLKPASAIETHVETLEMLCVKCKGAFWQMQFPPNEKSWFKLLKSNSCRKARALRWLQHGLLSPPASSFSSPRYAEAGHKNRKYLGAIVEEPCCFLHCWHSLCSWLGRAPRHSPGTGLQAAVPLTMGNSTVLPGKRKLLPQLSRRGFFQPTLHSTYTRT